MNLLIEAALPIFSVGLVGVGILLCLWFWDYTRDVGGGAHPSGLVNPADPSQPAPRCSVCRAPLPFITLDTERDVFCSMVCWKQVNR